MILQDITELDVIGIFDRGVPNQERIVVKAQETVNLGQYGIMLGIRGADGSAFPIKDNLMWFGDGIVHEGDWLFIYTGPGEAKTNSIPNALQSLYTIHWGRTNTVLGSMEIVPILFRIDAVLIKNEQMTLLPKP